MIDNVIKKVYFGHAPKGVKSEHAERAYHAEDGWKIESVDDRTVRLTKDDVTFTVGNIPFRVVTDSKRRSLDPDDFRRMNLPPEFWRVSTDKVPEGAQEPVNNYLSQASTLVNEGVGFVLSGDAGVGKTSIAALLAAEARRLGFTAFFTTVSDLREMIRNRIAFDPTASVLERCRDVRLLILDNLRPEDAREHPFDAAALEGLLESRVQWNRATILTTRMKFEEFAKTYKSAMEILRGHSAFFDIIGVNQRESEERRLLKRLGLIPEQSEQKIGELRGSAHGTSTTTGTLTGIGALAGTAKGTSTLTGTLHDASAVSKDDLPKRRPKK